jgi:type VI protein secretion system component Hcp
MALDAFVKFDKLLGSYDALDSDHLDGWSRVLRFEYSFSEDGKSGVFSLDKATDASTTQLYNIYFLYVVKPKLKESMKSQEGGSKADWHFETIQIALCRMEAKDDSGGGGNSNNNRIRFAEYTFKSCKLQSMSTSIGSDGAHVDNLKVTFHIMSLKYNRYNRNKGILSNDAEVAFSWNFKTNTPSPF